MSRAPLPPPPAGIEDFWVLVHVILDEPFESADPSSDTPTQGYYRHFGIRCRGEDMQRVVEAQVTDGRVDWPECEISLPALGQLDADIVERIEPIEETGCWYRSGCVFYADSALEP